MGRLDFEKCDRDHGHFLLPEQVSGIGLRDYKLVELLELGVLAELSSRHFIESVDHAGVGIPGDFLRYLVPHSLISLHLSDMAFKFGLCFIFEISNRVDSETNVKRLLQLFVES